MSVPVSFELESPSWLRNIRWAQVAGMSASVAVAHFYGVRLPLSTLGGILGLLALWNLFLPQIELHFFASAKAFLGLQLLVDLAAFTAVLWWSGGLLNPFVTFVALHVLIAGLLLNSLVTLIMGAFAVAVVWTLAAAPALEFRGELVDLRASPLWAGVPVALTLLVLLTTLFVYFFLHRLGRAQDELRQRIKMDALGRLVAGLAHEIGTPLNSILLLAKELAESAEGALQRNLQLIEGQAKRCGEIVSLLLGYSNTLVRRDEDIQYSKVDLVPWVQGIWRWLEEQEAKLPQQKRRTGVKFEIQARDLPKRVAIPALVMRQVLENIIKNSIDATQEIAQPKIVVQIYPDLIEDDLVFVVHDNGPGFSEEDREKAFEAFFSTKIKEMRPGLGLYISYYLLGQVCGRIAIEEHAGPGAIMRVTVPRLEELDDQAS